MELASKQLRTKIESARALLARMSDTGVAPVVAPVLAAELAAIEMRLALCTSHLYLATSEAGRAAATAEHARILAAEGFANDVDQIVARGVSAAKSGGVSLRVAGDAAPAPPPARPRRVGRGRAAAADNFERKAASTTRKSTAVPVTTAAAALAPVVRAAIPPATLADVQRLLDLYPRGEGRADGAPQQVDYEHCPTCGAEMAVDASKSQLRCRDETCGAIRELDGIVFDDAQFYSQEGQKAKSGSFNPNRHFYSWWCHLYALESEEELGDRDDPENQTGQKVVAALAALVARDQKVMRLLTVDDMRDMLKEINRADLNKNVPLLMKKLTGIGPPAPTDEITVRAENLFTKAIEISDSLASKAGAPAAVGCARRRAARVNRNYYPYYIGQILDAIIPPEEHEARRILYYIYIQSEDTVSADDDDWEQICAELKEIKFKPTDRTLAQKYAPIH